MADLLLDPDIRNWVIIPLFLIIFLMGILRHNIMVIIQSPPTPNPQVVYDTQLVTRTKLLQQNAHHIPRASFMMRKQCLLHEEKGALTQKRPGPANPMTDPSQMNNMMKNSLSGIVPQLVMFWGVSMFFSGFVLLRMPFPLTQRFKTMLLRGVDLPSLDPSWVSSASWYFTCMYGMNGLHSLVLGENNEASQAAAMRKTMPGMGDTAGQPVDWGKIMSAEKDNLQLVEHKFDLAQL